MLKRNVQALKPSIFPISLTFAIIFVLIGIGKNESSNVAFVILRIPYKDVSDIHQYHQSTYFSNRKFDRKVSACKNVVQHSSADKIGTNSIHKLVSTDDSMQEFSLVLIVVSVLWKVDTDVEFQLKDVPLQVNDRAKDGRVDSIVDQVHRKVQNLFICRNISLANYHRAMLQVITFA